MVRVRTRLPRRAAASPRAAATVVFPTPPHPTQRMTRRESIKSERLDGDMTGTPACTPTTRFPPRARRRRPIPAMPKGLARPFEKRACGSCHRIRSRARSRSEDPLVALSRSLEGSRKRSGIDVIVVADPSGFTIAGAGPAARCDDLAARAAVLAGASRSQRHCTLPSRYCDARARRPAPPNRRHRSPALRRGGRTSRDAPLSRPRRRVSASSSGAGERGASPTRKAASADSTDDPFAAVRRAR